MARRGNLVLAVSTGGDSPALAAKLRTIFEKNIPDNIEEILSALREARATLKKMDHLTHSERGEILKKIVGDDKLLSSLILNNKNGTLLEMLKKFK
jgi:siroheme synthase (precorrin-2 oxidase/ferrochelatase)